MKTCPKCGTSEWVTYKHDGYKRIRCRECDRRRSEKRRRLLGVLPAEFPLDKFWEKCGTAERGIKKDGHGNKATYCKECKRRQDRKYNLSRGRKPRKLNLEKAVIAYRRSFNLWLRKYKQQARLAAKKSRLKQYDDLITCNCGHGSLKCTYNGMCIVCNAACQRKLRSIRRARKRNCYPPLSQKEKTELKLIYASAQNLTTKTGTLHEVDHIKPLALGGEHRPSNLQVLTAEAHKIKTLQDKHEIYAQRAAAA